jgi:hypothetical protein
MNRCVVEDAISTLVPDERTGMDHATRADRKSMTGRRLVVAAVALAVLATAGCRPHDESVKNPCPELSPRGAVALAKLGLTPRELKEQARC